MGRAMSQVLQILMFHRVLPERDPMAPEVPDAAEFLSQIKTLARYFNVLPLRHAVERLRSGDLPARAVSITFDDGYADNLAVAAPILGRYGLPATLFVASGFTAGGIMWNDRVIEAVRATRLDRVDFEDLGIRGALSTTSSRQQLAKKLVDSLKYLPLHERSDAADRIAARLGQATAPCLMLSESGLRELASTNFEIGAHTVNHPILTRISLRQAREEIEAGRQFLESCLDRTIDGFAYPNGRPNADYALEHRDLVVEMGFAYAVSTAWGSARTGDDLFQLPRLGFPQRRSVDFGLRLFKSRWDRPSYEAPAAVERTKARASLESR